MLVIIDYGLGNLASIKNMLKRIGKESTISSDPDIIQKASKLILPGIGAFAEGMKNIKALGLEPVLNEMVVEKKTPVLGICLGMQLLSRFSEEGNVQGLGWIEGDTKRFQLEAEEYQSMNLKVPLMGWQEVTLKKGSPLFAEMHEEPRFYFVHTYHMVCDQPEDVLLSATHGYEFACGVESENVIGVQFHPEKSHKFGMKLLENFVNKY